MQKLASLGLAVLLSLGLVSKPAASLEKRPEKKEPEEIRLVINGQPAQIPKEKGEIYVDPGQSRTMVPVRYLGERLGFTVDYREGAHTKDPGTFILTGRGKKIEMVLNSKLARVEEWTGQGTYTKRDYRLDAPAVARRGRSYVPLRFLSEAMGYKVAWKPGQVEVKDPAYKPGPQELCTSREDMLARLEDAMDKGQRSLYVNYKGVDVKGLLPQVNYQLGPQSGLKAFHYTTWDNKKVEFTMDYRSGDEQKEKAKAYVRSWVEREIGKEDSDLDKIVKIHREVLEKTGYYSGDGDLYRGVDVHTAESIVYNGTAVCQGYAQLVHLLCKEAGLASCVVAGPADFAGYKGPHAWNLVRLDGKWYHLDPTWDDTNGKDPYLFFLKSDDFMKESRSWQGDFPKALENYNG